jgi:lipopolysaccharide transport system permease protein
MDKLLQNFFLARFIKNMQLAGMLGWSDVRQAYRRSAIGPFWMTLSMSVQILAMSVVFSLIFKINLQQYLPWLTCSMMLWTFVSASVNDLALSFTTSDSILKQVKIPLYIFTARVLWKNTLIFLHNAIILPIVMIFFSAKLTWGIFLFIPGFLVTAMTLAALGTTLGIACARYRDLPPIINSILVVAYYVTPILWQPGTLGDSALAHWLLGLNPLYHLFQITRQPLVGEMPTFENWFGASVLLIVCVAIAISTYKKYQKKVPFWV